MARFGVTRKLGRVPKSALVLGLLGLLPFIWGGLTALSDLAANWSDELVGTGFSGNYLLIRYGVVILSFMAGVIWGFAARSEGRLSAIGLVLSVLPALWIFFLGDTLRSGLALSALAIGFVGLLLVDWFCDRNGMAPSWWLPYRLFLTSIVLTCLGIGLIAGTS